MELIIKKIQERLSSEVPDLKYVDQDWGQMDFFVKPPVKFPCALIDIQSAQYSNTGEFVQQGTAQVVIRLFDIKLSNSSHLAPEGQKESVKRIWLLLKDVNKAIHAQNFLPKGYGLLIRDEMRRTKRDDGCFQTELHYSLQFTDNSCQPILENAPSVTPKLINLRYVK